MPQLKSYSSLMSQIKRLQHEAAIVREREKKPILTAIANAIHHYEITLPELRTALGDKPGSGRAARNSGGGRPRGGPDHPLAGRKIPAKYRDPKSGQVWSGRGSTPTWLRDLEASGVKRDTLLIKRRKG